MAFISWVGGGVPASIIISFAFGQQRLIDQLTETGFDPEEFRGASRAEMVPAIGERWASDDMRRTLDLEVVRRTERHPGRWVAVRGGRVVAVDWDRVFRREVQAGAGKYWVAPPGAVRPRLP
jgi:hypothetical protein